MKTLIVLPAYNEAKVLSKTLTKLRKQAYTDLVVVDDGSGDSTAEIAQREGAKVLRHPINLGLGAALETGLEYARRKGYDQVVTFDADGQHNPKDISKLLKYLGEADVVIGVRVLNPEGMPAVKKLGNGLLNLLTGLIFGVYSKDSQSGLRAFNEKALDEVRVKANRYEVSSEILYEARRKGLKIVEVPVEVIYTKHSIANGTTVVDGFKILWRMLLHQRIR